LRKESESLTQLALQKFKRNFWGVSSFWFIVAAAFVAIFAYVLAPDNSAHANQMHLSIHSKSPGFTVEMLRIPGKVKPRSSWFHRLFLGRKNAPDEIPITGYHFTKDSLIITPYHGKDIQGIKQSFALKNNFPEQLSQKDIAKNYIVLRKFWLGTDKYGRDFLSRMLIGIRISLSIGFVAVLISLIIGIALGAIAGYYGGKIDQIIMWLINVTWSIPTLLLVIAMTLALGKGFWQVFIAVGLTMWVE